ncbi:acyl carrier protein [Ruminococcaceae bacterium KH2T8]|nr:acyl carrier protein [Ruminococcaceae bacterium KH2T8]
MTMDDTADPRERNFNDEDIMKKKDMIFEDILKLLVAELDVSPTDIKPDMTISDDLNFDSLQLYEFVIDIEEAYDIRLPDDLLDNVKTISDMIDLVYKLSSEPKD